MVRLALHWQIALGMVAGAAIGVALNLLAGTATTHFATGLPAGLTSVTVTDAVGRTVIETLDAAGRGERIEVGLAAAAATRFESVVDLRAKRPDLAALVDQARPAPANLWGRRFQRLGGLFLRMLKMVAVPLVVTSLASGIMGLGGAARLGRMFGRTLTYYVVTSLLAIVTGMAAVAIIRPGLGGQPRPGAGAAAPLAGGGLADVLFQQVESLIPANPFAALAEPDFLSIIAFTLAFAIFALRVGGEAAAWVQRAADAGFAVMMAMTHAIIRLAPLGVFCLVAATTATQGADVFRSLAAYMLTVALGLVVHGCITLPLIVRVLARRSPWQFARAMSPALLTAFSSASSNAALPLTLDCAESRAGIRNRVGSFVLPLGATVNMDGTALYEAVAVLFIAQLHFGHDLTLAQQAVVCVTALLASVGAAGIPHAGLVMMAIILQAVGLPAESQGIILAVDRVLDMGRTTVNVWSDACGAAVIDTLEGPDEPRG
ncbi:MAG: dicarboxylate/amino acid:cation symporter [Planctomycetota bacterium]